MGDEWEDDGYYKNVDQSESWTGEESPYWEQEEEEDVVTFEYEQPTLLPPPNRNKWLIARRWRRAFLHVTYNRYQSVLAQQESHNKAAAFLTSLRKKKGVVPGIAAAEEDVANNPAPSPGKLNHAYARLGILFFEEGEYLKAIEWFKKSETRKHKSCKLIRICGQAYIRLFEEEPTKFEYLAEARVRLFEALTLHRDPIEAMVTLPNALMELANVYERYGAFEGALQVMGKVTEFFHGYGKYFEVLHRCVVVMTHLSYIPGSDREALMLRCVDFLDTIFEEKKGGRHPLSRRDDVLLLYARCSIRCARSIRDVLSPLIRVSQAKGEAAFDEVFNSRKEAEEEDAVGHLSWRAWISSPDTMLLLAREHADMGELTLAALFYDEFYDSIGPSKLRKHKEGLNICLEATYNNANFQDMKTAVIWAIRGFEIREHDSRIREFLGMHSPKHAELFREEALAAESAQRHWRKRILNPRYYEAYIEAQLVEWEKHLSNNYWDSVTRTKLAFFARSKWRGLFLFEEATATRIQQWVKRTRSNRLYRAFMLEAHLKKCARALNNLRVRKYHPSTRNTAIELANHKMTPENHRLKQIQEEFDEEDEAAIKMQRQYKRLLANRMVTEMKSRLMLAVKEARQNAATTIQQSIRSRWARDEFEARMERKEARESASLILQRFWLRKRKAWQIAHEIRSSQMGLILAKKQRRAALIVQRYWRGHKHYKLVHVTWVCSATKIQCKFRGFKVRNHYWKLKQFSAQKLQRFWREQVGRRRWTALLKHLVEMKNAPPQPLSSYLLYRCLEKGRKPIYYPGIGDGSDVIDSEKEDGDDDSSGAPGGQLLPWFHSPLSHHQINQSFGTSEQVKSDDNSTFDENGWCLPEYKGIGLPGSPAWLRAADEKEVIFIADRYRDGLKLPSRDKVEGNCVDKFSTADVLMLACLVRHASCKLDTIALFGADLSNTDAAMELVSAISDNRSLRRLVLAGCNIEFEAFTALFRACAAHNYTLKELLVDGNPLKCGGVGRLAAPLMTADFFGSQYGRLETLSLCRMGLDDEDMSAIAKAIGESISHPPSSIHQESNMKRGGPKQWSLSLSGSLGSGHLGIAQDNERSSGSLRRLALGENEVSDGGCLALLQGLMLKDNVNKKWIFEGRKPPPGLWELELGGNRLTDESVEKLLKYIVSTTPKPPPSSAKYTPQTKMMGPSKRSVAFTSNLTDPSDRELLQQKQWFTGLAELAGKATQQPTSHTSMISIPYTEDSQSPHSSRFSPNGLCQDHGKFSTLSVSSSNEDCILLDYKQVENNTHVMTGDVIVSQGKDIKALNLFKDENTPVEEKLALYSQFDHDYFFGLKAPTMCCSIVKLGLSNNLIQDRIIRLIELLPVRCPWLYITLDGNLFRPEMEDRVNESTALGHCLFEYMKLKREQKDMKHFTFLNQQPTDADIINNSTENGSLAQGRRNKVTSKSQSLDVSFNTKTGENHTNSIKKTSGRVRSDDSTKVGVLFTSRLMQSYEPPQPLSSDVHSIDINKGKFRFLDKLLDESELLDDRKETAEDAWHPLPLPKAGSYTSKSLSNASNRLELMSAAGSSLSIFTNKSARDTAFLAPNSKNGIDSVNRFGMNGRNNGRNDRKRNNRGISSSVQTSFRPSPFSVNSDDGRWTGSGRFHSTTSFSASHGVTGPLASPNLKLRKVIPSKNTMARNSHLKKEKLDNSLYGGGVVATSDRYMSGVVNDDGEEDQLAMPKKAFVGSI